MTKRRMWRAVVVGLAGIVVAAACNESPPTASREAEMLRPRRSYYTTALPCAIEQAPPAGGDPSYFLSGTPTTGVACGISWSMTFPPIIIAPYERAYLWQDAPSFGSLSRAFFIGSYGGRQNGPNDLTFYSNIEEFSSEVVFQSSIYGPVSPDQRIQAFNDSGRLVVDTVGGLATTIRAPRVIRMARTWTEKNRAAPSGKCSTVHTRRSRSITSHRLLVVTRRT